MHAPRPSGPAPRSAGPAARAGSPTVAADGDLPRSMGTALKERRAQVETYGESAGTYADE